MTTPEKLRRRQLFESGLLIAIGIIMVVQSVYFARTADAQQACLVSKFQELSVALDARAELSEQESDQNRALWGIYAEAAGIVKASGKPAEEALTDKQRAELNKKLIAQLLEYQRVLANIQRERREHPVPPYPTGACDR